MKKKTTYILAFIVISSCLNFRAFAQDDFSTEADYLSLGELLEEGIYLQETKSAFEEAIGGLFETGRSR